MQASLILNDSPSLVANYVGWAPSPCAVRLTNSEGVTAPVTVVLRNQRTDVGGQVVFYTHTDAGYSAASDTLTLILPLNNTAVQCYVGGKFGRPSTADKDAAIEVVATDGTILSTTRLMVRVRKNAEELTVAERDLFLDALGTLNGQGAGSFQLFRQMHQDGLPMLQAHGDTGFLPWHRAYLLDLERELQRITPAVTLPYWQFYAEAPKLFSPEFLGATTASGFVDLIPGHALEHWKTNEDTGIKRTPRTRVNPSNRPASFTRNQHEALAKGPNFLAFWGIGDTGMEGSPHGEAHTMFNSSSWVSRAPNAPKDPLFFLLHANVDRLWAMWQSAGKGSFARFDATTDQGYHDSMSGLFGHSRNDTMWPWDENPTAAGRPQVSPGGPLVDSPTTTAPGPKPRVSQMLDYQGILNPAARLGYDYEDVPFDPMPLPSV